MNGFRIIFLLRDSATQELRFKLQSTQRPRRTLRSLGEESGVNFELKEFASTPAGDRNEVAKIYLLACFQLENTL